MSVAISVAQQAAMPAAANQHAHGHGVLQCADDDGFVFEGSSSAAEPLVPSSNAAAKARRGCPSNAAC